MKNKKAQTVLLIALVIVVIVLTGFIIFQFANPSITGNVIKENSCEEIQVPYETQEEYVKTEYYTETVPYEVEVPLKHQVSHFDTVVSYDTGAGYGCGSLFNYVKCYRIMITNLDTVGGIFKVTCHMRTISEEFSQEIDRYVKPGDNEEVLCEADVDVGVDVELSDIDVIPPKKEEVEFKEVQRERQVTDYKPVTKYRTETECA